MNKHKNYIKRVAKGLFLHSTTENFYSNIGKFAELLNYIEPLKSITCSVNGHDKRIEYETKDCKYTIDIFPNRGVEFEGS